MLLLPPASEPMLEADCAETLRPIAAPERLLVPVPRKLKACCVYTSPFIRGLPPIDSEPLTMSHPLQTPLGSAGAGPSILTDVASDGGRLSTIVSAATSTKMRPSGILLTESKTAPLLR